MNIKDLETKVKMISEFLIKESIEENYDILKNTVSEIITPTLISYVEIQRLFLFRARKIDDISNIDALTNLDIWLPPVEKTELGRCNVEKIPVLYGALDPVTAINETKITKGDYFLLGCYEMLEKNNGSELERTAIIGIPNGDNKDTPLSRITQGITSNFLYTEFTREITKWNTERYYVTNAIVDHLFNKMKFRSIIYPSVINNKRMNILLNQEAAFERAAFYYMYVCKILEISGTQFKAYIYKSFDQVETKGELNWRTLDNTRVFTFDSEGPEDQVEVIKKRLRKHSE
jgi:RES domain-containing protein